MPSPNVQLQVVGVPPVEISINWTLRGALPETGAPIKLATGGETGAVAALPIRLTVCEAMMVFEAASIIFTVHVPFENPVLFRTDAVESATHEPEVLRNSMIEAPGFQPCVAVPGRGTKLYEADPFVNENFTGIPDVVAGASETVSPCDINKRTAETFVMVTGVASVTIYAVFWTGTAQPRKIDPITAVRAMTRMIARTVLTISETPLSHDCTRPMLVRIG